LLRERLKARDDGFSLAWWLSTGYTGNGFWLLPRGCFLGSASFRQALCDRLLLHSLRLVSGGTHFSCPRCPRVVAAHSVLADTGDSDALDDQDKECPLENPLYHHLSCQGTSRFRLNRHNSVSDELASFLRTNLGVGGNVVVEEAFPGQDRSAFRPDIRVTDPGGFVHYIDVSVVNPACKSNAQRGSAEIVGASSAFAESYKHSKYRQVLADANIMSHRFHPFVLEATGRFGSGAMLF